MHNGSGRDTNEVLRPRFFLFHASLIVALAILGDAESPECEKWQVDVDMACGIFRGVLIENPLASRCLEILEHILPLGRSDALREIPLSQFDINTADLSLWPADLANMFGSF